MYRHTPQNALIECSNRLVTVLQRTTFKTAERTTVLFIDDDIMGDINKTAGQISGIGRLHGRISQTFASTVGGDEVLQHGHSFLKVGDNRVLNNLRSFGAGFLRFRHQTTHTGKLCDLVSGTTGTGVEHHVNGIEPLIGLGHVLHHTCLQVVVHMCPGINHLIVTLLIGDETHLVVGFHLVDLVLTFPDNVFLLLRYDNIVKVERETCHISHAITEVLDPIQELTGTRHTDSLDNVGDKATE